MDNRSEVQIVITFSPLDGTLKVVGPMQSPVVFLGMLEQAKSILLRQQMKKQMDTESAILKPKLVGGD